MVFFLLIPAIIDQTAHPPLDSRLSSDLLLLAVSGDAGLRVVCRPAAVAGGSDDGEGRDRLPQLQHLPHPLEGDRGAMDTSNLSSNSIIYYQSPIY